jgi:hypothetical protein
MGTERHLASLAAVALLSSAPAAALPKRVGGLCTAENKACESNGTITTADIAKPSGDGWNVERNGRDWVGCTYNVEKAEFYCGVKGGNIIRDAAESSVLEEAWAAIKGWWDSLTGAEQEKHKNRKPPPKPKRKRN